MGASGQGEHELAALFAQLEAQGGLLELLLGQVAHQRGQAHFGYGRHQRHASGGAQVVFLRKGAERRHDYLHDRAELQQHLLGALADKQLAQLGRDALHGDIVQQLAAAQHGLGGRLVDVEIQLA